MEVEPISKETIMESTTLSSNMHATYKREEEHWRLKSRRLWLQEGDRSTSFFDNQTNAWLHYNQVEAINTEGGRYLIEFKEINNMALKHLKDIYLEEGSYE